MKKIFRLEGLECANCAAKMEKEISKLDGVKEATVNFMSTKLTIEADEEKMEEIILASEKIVKKIESDVKMKRV
ncbi:MAG: cation transporter [Bacilli bacterium]|nr:cation transporter [Bacilli bacterium]